MLKKIVKKETAPVRAGVDFGTTHTVAALADGGNYPVLSLPFEYGGEIITSDRTPSCVALLGKKLYYGSAALKCWYDNYHKGASLLPSLKRHLQNWHENLMIPIGDQTFPARRLLTGFLAEIRRSMLMALDLKAAVIETVIAVPANASSSQRYITLQCFRDAGFKVVRILDEPVASGIQFVHERYKRWDRVESDVIIYDLGGGTFDATLLSIRRGEYDPVLSRGISRLGGDDFDDVLLGLAEKASGQRFEGRDRIEMLQNVRQVKESIGPYTQKLHIDAPQGEITLAVRDFYEASMPLLNKTIEMVDSILKESGSPGEPDRIVTVGGGSLPALVTRTLRERFGKARIHQGLYPFASVAIGAAIQAESPDLVVTDRLTRHFGVIRLNGEGREYVDVIFEKGLKLPRRGHVLSASRPAYDPRHNIGHFKYLECDALDTASGLPSGDAVYWNEVLFPYDREINPDGLPPSEAALPDIRQADHLGGERIIEEYELDECGIITARIARTVQDRYVSCHNLYRQ